MESSENHRITDSKIHFGSLAEINDPSIGPTKLYGRTKLAMILGVKYGLVERVIKPNGDKIYALSVHPGVVRDLSDWINSAGTETGVRSIRTCRNSGSRRIRALRARS